AAGAGAAGAGAPRRAGAAGAGAGGVPGRLRAGALRGRVLSPSRRPLPHPGQSAGPCAGRAGLGGDHGAAAVAADGGGGRGLRPVGAEVAVTPLARIIAARIRAEGPMPLVEYMRLCLMHPQHGYYSTRDPFGAQGDFTTAPEISQMFGELVGLGIGRAAWRGRG